MERHQQIAKNLDQLIKDAGITPSALAKSVGLGHTAARDIILGKSRNPTDRTLYLLAKGLGVHISSITGEAPSEFGSHEPASIFPGEVEELRVGEQTSDTLRHLAPKLPSALVFLVLSDAPGFGYSTGDLLIVDPDKSPQAQGETLIVRRQPGRTQLVAPACIGKFFPPYVVPADPAQYGVAFDPSSPTPNTVAGVVVGSFRLDPGTTAALLNGSHDLD